MPLCFFVCLIVCVCACVCICVYVDVDVCSCVSDFSTTSMVIGRIIRLHALMKTCAVTHCNPT